MTDHLLDLHGDVLGAMRRGPKPFAKLAFAVSDETEPTDTTLESLRERIITGGPGDELSSLWHRTLTGWDFAEVADWSSFPARTNERRADTYSRLGFGADLRKAFDEAVPVHKHPGPVVISTKFEPWYSKDSADARAFYWPAYENKLRAKGWSDAAVAGLDEASRKVVERLASPSDSAARSAKGLVVGYVQSGKTANFTGVSAKAIDAGYRLVIVLGGTLNLLRGQTQRRLDMELIGQENILRGADPADLDALIGVDYQDDEAWPDGFVSHGGRPSALGAFDIERLTTRDNDYKSLLQGIRALEFEKREPTLPLYDPQNLHRAAARVMVVKKNKSVLTNLVNDLKQIGPILREIPTLIIDDESDQASVNTLDSKKWEAGKPTRTAINGLISQLLKLLPRAQYVGYTATPFANVFVDPGDDEDIFPSDFLISLPRPTGYMGVQDFHDLDSAIPYSERTIANSQEKAHVRGIYASDDEGASDLQQAMDSFILSGAIKLYRAAHGVPEGPFRHHTMLVHESIRKDDHSELALRINTMWHQASYTGAEGHTRLRALYDTDFKKVSEAHADGLPVPASYDDLKPHVSRARQLINQGGKPVLIVNGDRYLDQPDLDFDRQPHVWKILVGGTKLSRGFTVEGLTITYYRRTTQQADTLMQMGRWFGFRPGYRDLVRLYIGREEPLGKKPVDLYEAFEAVCRDEETFRAQLAQYSELIDGRPQVTPAQIPPLVSQHLSWIKPSSRNKMFNAELVEIRSPGRWIEPMVYPTDTAEIRHNTEIWQPVLHQMSTDHVVFVHLSKEDRSQYVRYPAATTIISNTQLSDVMSSLAWSREHIFAPHLQYLSDTSSTGNNADDWVVIVPQTSGPKSVAARILNSQPLTLVQRKRNTHGIFNRISGMAHRQSAERIAGILPPTEEDPYAIRLAQPRRGALLLYPVIDPELGPLADVAANGVVPPGKVVMAFAIIPPGNPIGKKAPLVRFRTIDSTSN